MTQVGIFGAGSIGTFLGLRLAAAGVTVRLLGRSRLLEARDRLEAVDIALARHPVTAALDVTTDAAALADCEVCLVTVKSKDTEEAGATLRDVLDPFTPVVSLQNGLTNGERLASVLGPRAVGGVFGYNVYREDTRYVQATSGEIYAGLGEGITAHRLRQLRAWLRRAGEELVLVEDIAALMAGKLLLNLNNGICAATGLPIVESIRDRDGRWCFGACLAEGVRVVRAAGIEPAQVTALPPTWIARLLPLPDEVVMRVAKTLVDVAPEARSSTLQDLDRGVTRTEIDDLNGAIVELARRHGTRAPANETVCDAVHAHEASIAAGETPRWLSPAELRRRIEAAAR